MSSTFGSPPLVRVLAPYSGAGAAVADVAEGLGQWVSAFDAIGLQAALQSIRAMPPVARAVAPPASLAEDFERAHGTLARAIALDAVLPNETTYAAYRRRHQELQRQMEPLIAALRDHVRQALARGALPLRKLAALDTALEQVIARREQSALPVATALLERRFEQLRRGHLAKVKASGAEDDPAGWRRPGGWLHEFEGDWREALRAELHLRLEPVAGLLEAAGIELESFP